MPSGRLYYQDHSKSVSQYLPPSEAWDSYLQPDGAKLPYGLEQALSMDGVTYYIDHLHMTTTWAVKDTSLPETPNSHSVPYAQADSLPETPGSPILAASAKTKRAPPPPPTRAKGAAPHAATPLHVVQSADSVHIPPSTSVKILPHKAAAMTPSIAPFPLKIQLHDSQYRTVLCDGKTTAKDVESMILEKFALSDSSDLFSIRLSVPDGPQYYLPAHTVIAEERSIMDKKAQCCLRFFLVPNDLEQLQRSKPLALEFYYNQEVRDFLKGELGECTEDTALKLAAIITRIWLLNSSHKKFKASFLGDELELSSILPEYFLSKHKPKEIVKKIEHALKQVDDHGGIPALRLQFLQTTSGIYALLGRHFFFQSLTSSSDKVKVVITPNSGVSLMTMSNHVLTSNTALLLAEIAGVEAEREGRREKEGEGKSVARWHLGDAVRLRLRQVKPSSSPLELVIEYTAARDIVMLLDGYYRQNVDMHSIAAGARVLFEEHQAEELAPVRERVETASPATVRKQSNTVDNLQTPKTLLPLSQADITSSLGRMKAAPPRYRGLHTVLFQNWNYAPSLRPVAEKMASSTFSLDLHQPPPVYAPLALLKRTGVELSADSNAFNKLGMSSSGGDEIHRRQIAHAPKISPSTPSMAQVPKPSPSTASVATLAPLAITADKPSPMPSTTTSRLSVRTAPLEHAANFQDSTPQSSSSAVALAENVLSLSSSVNSAETFGFSVEDVEYANREYPANISVTASVSPPPTAAAKENDMTTTEVPEHDKKEEGFQPFVFVSDFEGVPEEAHKPASYRVQNSVYGTGTTFFGEDTIDELSFALGIAPDSDNNSDSSSDDDEELLKEAAEMIKMMNHSGDDKNKPGDGKLSEDEDRNDHNDDNNDDDDEANNDDDDDEEEAERPVLVKASSRPRLVIHVSNDSLTPVTTFAPSVPLAGPITAQPPANTIFSSVNRQMSAPSSVPFQNTPATSTNISSARSVDNLATLQAIHVKSSGTPISSVAPASKASLVPAALPPSVTMTPTHPAATPTNATATAKGLVPAPPTPDYLDMPPPPPPDLLFPPLHSQASDISLSQAVKEITSANSSLVVMTQRRPTATVLDLVHSPDQFKDAMLDVHYAIINLYHLFSKQPVAPLSGAVVHIKSLVLAVDTCRKVFPQSCEENMKAVTLCGVKASSAAVTILNSIVQAKEYSPSIAVLDAQVKILDSLIHDPDSSESVL